MNKIYLIIISTALLFSCKPKEKPKDLHFYVAGHVYGAPGVINHPFHPPFQKYFKTTQSDTTINFAVFTGDIVQESDLRSWNSVDSLLEKSKYPVHFAPGNHDLKNRELYENRYGKPNYHFINENNLFVFWDVLPTGWNISEEQISEVEKLTKEEQVDNVFIFSHHIFWQHPKYAPRVKVNSTYGKSNDLNFYNAILPRMNQLNTPIYIFGGDVGAIQGGSYIAIHQYNNIHFIASGMGGGEWENVVEVSVKNGNTSINLLYLNDSISPMIIDTLYNKIWL